MNFLHNAMLFVKPNFCLHHWTFSTAYCAWIRASSTLRSVLLVFRMTPFQLLLRYKVLRHMLHVGKSCCHVQALASKSFRINAEHCLILLGWVVLDPSFLLKKRSSVVTIFKIHRVFCISSLKIRPAVDLPLSMASLMPFYIRYQFSRLF